MLKAIGSCEYEGCSAEFCDAHGIRLKAMKEVRKLRVQLTNAVNTVIPEANICVDPKMAPPDDIQAKLLRQIVLAGLADHVARKYPEMLAASSDANRKKYKNAYQCPELEEPVFIHPTSILYKERPEFVVYQHITETSKMYMKGITAVEPEWLPLFASSHVTFSEPMENPPPEFDSEKGQVMCYMKGTFGHCAWELPISLLEYPTGLEKIKWFAKFFLEGKVFPKLRKFSSDLLSLPSTMVKTWAKLQPRTEVLLKALVSERVDSKELLVKMWQKQPKYLLSAMKEWIPQSKHDELELTWPPV